MTAAFLPTLRELAQRSTHGLPERLLSAPTQRAIGDLLDALPTTPTECLFFEMYLDDARDGVDLITTLDAEIAASVARPDWAPALRDGQTRGPGWDAFFDVCRHWSDTNGALYRSTHPTMWMEMDAHLAGDTLHAPGVLVHPKPDVQSCADQVLDPLLAVYAPASRRRALVEQAKAIERGLPDAAFVAYYGIFFRRSMQTVRLCLRNLPHENLPPLLRQHGWDGDTGPLGAFLNGVHHMRRRGVALDHSYVHVDVSTEDEGVGPRVCVEVFAESQQGLHLLMEYLDLNGLCRSEERDALQAWLASPASSEAFLAGRSVSLERRLNHFKIVARAGQPLRVKAYARVRARADRSTDVAAPATFATQ